MNDALFGYFAEELEALQARGAALGRAHPRLAGRLGLASEGGADPELERLLQGFALLAARLHQRLDEQDADLAEALLDRLYPHLARPLPARGIVHLVSVGGTGGAFAAAPVTIPAGTELAAPPLTDPRAGELRGLSCRFRTIYPVEVAPLELVETCIETIEPGSPVFVEADMPSAPDPAAAVDALLRLRLRTPIEGGFCRLGLSRLRLHLHGDPRHTVQLYELLLGRSVEAWIRACPMQGSLAAPAPRRLRLAPVGFEPEEALLPGVPDSLHGTRLLLEHFAFPAKFLFVDMLDLPVSLGPAGSDQEVEVVVGLCSRERRRGLELLRRGLGPDPLLLGCTPVVNLFSCEADPIRLTHTAAEMPIVVDQRRPGGFEVYSVEDVTLVGQGGRLNRQPLQPLHARHRRSEAWRSLPDGREAGLQWAVRRVSGPDGMAGLRLSLLDRQMREDTPTDGVLLPRVLATNGDIPADLPSRAPEHDVTLDGVAGVVGRRLGPFHRSIRPASGGAARWRLLSHLAGNRRSLADGDAAALRELLGAYAPPPDAGDPQLALEVAQQIEAIVGIRTNAELRPMGEALERSLVRGLRVELTIDEARLDIGSGFLLASVLDRFLAGFAAVNTFTRLVLLAPPRQERPLSWPPRIGLRPLL